MAEDALDSTPSWRQGIPCWRFGICATCRAETEWGLCANVDHDGRDGRCGCHAGESS
jgi:hypothetical protein